ncbi:MAG: nitrogen fixation protein NifZ [Alphaproteobacteria bacterium]|nr:nitrogen fixation protein NifZ [Alphaproteobacteria bacterium]
MLAEFEIGDEVRVIRNVRNDGTFPGLDKGALIMRRGTVGTVVDRGTFLQDQIIYTVHFLGDDRVVGCREEELIPASDPWVPSRFETRDRVVALKSFAVDGEVVAAVGSQGDILKVLRDAPGGIAYHVNFQGRVLAIPETNLDWAEPRAKGDDGA